MRYAWFTAALLLALLAAFALVEALEVPVLSDPRAQLDRATAPAAALGVGLLVADVVVPVPSSIVMTAHGALFGVAGGTSLSLVGSLGAALAGYAIGRRGGPLVDRVVPAADRERGDRLLARWGPLAVLVTRPVPLLAETVAILAGVAGIGARRVAVAALVGALPAALLYALAGSVADTFASTVLVLGAVLALGAVAWAVGRRA